MNRNTPENRSLQSRGDDSSHSARIIASESRGEFFSGPLPPPAVLERYESILPGLADRITTMAELQETHRHKLESRVITTDSIKSVLGLLFAFVIVCAGVGGAVYLARNDKNAEAAFIGLAPLFAVVGAFIYQQRVQKREETEEE